MKKAYKCALIPEQIERMLQLLSDNEKLVEIQLLSINDDLSLINKFNGKVSTIHLPIEKEDRTCNISAIIKTCKDKGSKYDFLCKVAEYAERENCGIVAHADITAEELSKINFNSFIDWLDEYKIRLYIENTPEILNARKSVLSPLYLTYSFNSRIKGTKVRPLLDICHFQISYNQYNSNLKHNLSEVVDLYSCEDMILHFNTAIGNGNTEKGGLHGGNFSENPELLEELLKDLKRFEPTLVLEVYDTDMINKPNEVALNNKIDEILSNQKEIKIDKIWRKY